MFAFCINFTALKKLHSINADDGSATQPCSTTEQQPATKKIKLLWLKKF